VAIATTRKTGATETLIAGQAIVRGAGGTVNRLETYRSGSYNAATGQFQGAPDVTQAFEYDGNARLTRETRTKAGATTDTAYEYDAAGNRRKKTVTTAAGAEITTYSYDAADRLTTESVSLTAGGTRVTNYTWDGNGNLASKTEPGKVTLYRFDAQNRLIDARSGTSAGAAQGSSPFARYAYDLQGNRTGKIDDVARKYLIDSEAAFPQLALEVSSAGGAGYLRGLELLQQTVNGNSTSEALFPLPGHLGTSLGAVGSSGSIEDELLLNAFGSLEQGSAPRQTHIYAGEYWDGDLQMHYLRARWYDPNIGRFISADPYEGKQASPPSLNRYAYADNSPVNGRDPSGRMTLGEIGSAMDSMFTLATRAYNAYDLLSSFIGGDDEGPVDGRPGLWDSLMGMAVRSLAGSVDVSAAGSGASASFAASVARRPRSPVDKHHTVPKYMCGNEQQWLVRLPYGDHQVLHSELTAFKFAINVAGVVFDRAFRKNRPIAQRDAVVRLARTVTGRATIAAGLQLFYAQTGWWNEGVPFAGAPFGAHTIGELFPYEAARFVANHHSYPTCTIR
jgi:RHS repeat-associated protein